jgi:type III secretory pathway lipoprotein EscJ
VLALLALLCLAGCKEQILHDLSETEANRIVSRLQGAELHAEKRLQSDGRWAIALPERQASTGLRYLEDRRVLSSQRGDALQFTKGGFVPSREEQRFRYERSIATAIEESLQAVRGVLEAHVHLNLPKADTLFGERADKSVGSSSVLLLVDERFETSDHDIARLVAGAVGLPADKISVLRSMAVAATATPAASPTSQPVHMTSARDDQLSQGVELRHGAAPIAERTALLCGAVGIVVLLASIYRKRRLQGLSTLVDHEN